jgi:hypothetical protein
VVPGHTLTTSATAHYAQDSGGGVWGPGSLGFALTANSGGAGTGTCSCLVKPYPLIYASAVSVTRTSTNNAVASGAGTTVISNLVSDGTNRLLLAYGFNINAASPASFAFNAGNFTSLQAGSASKTYLGYLLPSAATANVTANYTSNTGLGVVVLLNGINQGTPVGTYADATANSASVSVTIGCNLGDYVIAGFMATTVVTVSGRGAGQSQLANINNGSNEQLVVDYAIAAGSGITFTWTLSGAALWDAAGIAVKSA